MMKMWERLSAAIETIPSHVGYFMNPLVILKGEYSQ